MSEFGNQLTNKRNRDNLFPLHLYQETAKQSKQSQQTFLDENYHDQALPSTILQQAKSSLKIGKDTSFDTPIEKFGTKILENLGWKEGNGIGKDSSLSNAPIEYIPRQFRLGLGAKALTIDQITNNRQKTVTDNYEQSSIGKNIKRVGESLTVKKEITIGSNVNIIGGTHKGLSGEVIAMKKPNSLGDESIDEVYISVLLKSSGSVVQVKQKRLELKRDRSRSPEIQSFKIEQNPYQQSQKRLKWLHEGILVRCISREVHQGKLYGKELKILTIFDDKKFEASVEGKIYRDLNEKELETVLPNSKQLENKQRLHVMLLKGAQRGHTCKVLSVDKKKDVVNVQLDFTEILQVSQDDVSCLIESQ